MFRLGLRKVAFAAAMFSVFGIGSGVANDTSLKDNAATAAETELHRESVSRARVVVNKSRIIYLDRDYDTALMAKSEVADVVPLTTRSLYIVGKKVGDTRLMVLDASKQVQKIVEVSVGFDVGDLRAKLREVLPPAQIDVAEVNAGVLLTGSVHDAGQVRKAVAVAERFVPKENITNALAISSSQQVMLEVRFVEASRSASRELGVGLKFRNGRVATDTGGRAAGAGEILNAVTLASGSVPFGSMVAKLIEKGTNVDLLISALEERSLARRLAEPNLIALSGDTASFLAGGEFPFPVAADQDRITIEFKQFGVALAFTPTVLENGRVNLKIAPEVSEIDPTQSLLVNNTQIPGLVVRRASTTIELNDGQSFAVAGLLQHNNVKGQNQLPWIGNVPILGSLFRSAEFQRNETDLVIIVTPRLVRPKVPGETLETPLDRTKPTNDPKFFLTGKAELPPKARGTAQKTKLGRHRHVGHIITLADEVHYVPAK